MTSQSPEQSKGGVLLLTEAIDRRGLYADILSIYTHTLIEQAEKMCHEKKRNANSNEAAEWYQTFAGEKILDPPPRKCC